MKQIVQPTETEPTHITRLLVLLGACFTTGSAFAQEWGAHTLVPFSAQALVLEAVDSSTNEGAVVSIGKPAGTPNQKWVILPKGTNSYSIRPAYSSSLVLSVAKGGSANGTAVVLETDRGQPWQVWTIAKNDNGTFSLIPSHCPGKGLDDFGGKQSPGAKRICGRTTRVTRICNG